MDEQRIKEEQKRRPYIHIIHVRVSTLLNVYVFSRNYCFLRILLAKRSRVKHNMSRRYTTLVCQQA
jgi:hypothetical protein